MPPKGGIEISAVKMQSIFSSMAVDEKIPSLRESQNGMKYRTICGDCNSYLGLEFDPVINDFSLSVGRYVKSSIELPHIVNHKVKPQRLMKAILGHLLATKVNIENTIFDQQAREYVLNIDATLPENINVFYWIYPYQNSVAIRECCMFTPRGSLNNPTVFKILKYFPIAYLCCDNSEYENLNKLSIFRDVGIDVGIDDEVKIPINLKRKEDKYWP